MEEIDQIKTRVVGVDIREVKTTYALVDIRGEIISMDYFMTMDYPDVSDYVTALSEKIITLVEENGGYEKVRSVGLSAPSAICRGRESFPWLRCCATVSDWQWRWLTMHMSRPLARKPSAALTV